MPTDKKVIQAVIDWEYYSKFKKIKEKQRRKKDSDMARCMIETYIDNYEKEYGKIETSEQ